MNYSWQRIKVSDLPLGWNRNAMQMNDIKNLGKKLRVIEMENKRAFPINDKKNRKQLMVNTRRKNIESNLIS